MTPLVKQYDGRILMIDEQAHEVLGPIHGRPAVSLRSSGLCHRVDRGFAGHSFEPALASRCKYAQRDHEPP